MSTHFAPSAARRAQQREQARERQRTEMKSEILRCARRLLVEDGPGAVTLRAIARDMGMTAPGLYRYYADHRELIQALTAFLYDELTADLERACDQSRGASPADSFATTARALRAWALAHRAEFALIFSKPISDADCAPGDPCHAASWRFGGVFVGLMMDLWRTGTIRPPEPGTLDPAWLSQLEELREHVGTEPPLDILYLFVLAWSRLYGQVSMEVFGHLAFALADPEPLFEHTLSDILHLLGADAVARG